MAPIPQIALLLVFIIIVILTKTRTTPSTSAQTSDAVPVRRVPALWVDNFSHCSVSRSQIGPPQGTWPRAAPCRSNSMFIFVGNMCRNLFAHRFSLLPTQPQPGHQIEYQLGQDRLDAPVLVLNMRYQHTRLKLLIFSIPCQCAGQALGSDLT